MASCFDQSQDKDIFFNQVNQKPIRPDMTFVETCKLAVQPVITVLRFQRNSQLQFFNYMIQQS